jgi:hypothetical protein
MLLTLRKRYKYPLILIYLAFACAYYMVYVDGGLVQRTREMQARHPFWFKSRATYIHIRSTLRKMVYIEMIMPALLWPLYNHMNNKLPPPIVEDPKYA